MAKRYHHLSEKAKVLFAMLEPDQSDRKEAV
jgi:hypothetical protein